MNKNFSYHKVAVEDRKDEILAQEGNHSYWKKFHVISDKKQKIFFGTLVSKFWKISTLNICDGAKQIYPKKQKTILRKNTLRTYEAVIGRYFVKKAVPCYVFD